MVCSEIGLRDVLYSGIIDKFCCCKLMVNNKVIWSDIDEPDKYIGYENALYMYLSTHKNMENYVVTKINIKIVDFHHSIINLRCKKEKKYNENY